MLILVRHGQTEANARRLMCGHRDHPLTATGRGQADAVAASLTRPARLLTSPLGRARETAGILGRRLDVDVEIDGRWIEMDYGDLDGLPLGALDAQGWRDWRADAHHVPAGGESVAAVGARVRAACDELAAQAATDDVVVVSHVSPIKSAIAWALGVADDVVWRMFLLDGAVCRIDTSGSTPTLLAFNDAAPHAVAALEHRPDGDPRELSLPAGPARTARSPG